MTGRTARRRITRIALEAGQVSDRADLLAGEEPLGIRIGGQAVTLTMRTPGDDVDLAAGFLLTEGIVESAADIAAIRICSGEQCGHADHEDDAQDSIGNIADVTLRSGTDWQAPRRNFLATSACGVCGKASIADLRAVSRYDLTADAARVSAQVLAALPGKLRDAQRVFDRTGGLHAACAVRRGRQPAGEPRGRRPAQRGRQGARLGAAGRPGSRSPAACSWSAGARRSSWCKRPSWPASRRWPPSPRRPRWPRTWPTRPALTLVGFLRGGSMNVYTHPDRVVAA